MKNKICEIFSFVALDIETTGLDPVQDEIIEIGAVKYKNGHEIDRFSVFVSTEVEVPEFILQLTNIDINEINSGISQLDAIKKLKKFIKNQIVVCHNANFDMKFINKQCDKLMISECYNSIYDTLDLSRAYFPYLSNHKLKTVTDYLDIELKNAHRAIYDAEATAKVLFKIAEFAEDLIPLEVNNQLFSVAHIAKSDNDCDMFFEEIVNYQRKYALLSKPKKVFKSQRINYIEHYPSSRKDDNMNDVFGDEGIFANSFPKYEKRQGQIDMAVAVEEVFEKNNYLLVEAGTGVGKSFAYLVPAIRYASKNHEKIVLSTNTKNLQEQLFFKDLPVLKKLLNQPFRAVLLKGRDNYICKRKWQDLFFDVEKTLTPYDAQQIQNLIVWKNYTKTGDITENSSFDRKYSGSLWKKVVADRHFCLGKRCQFFGDCYVMDIRKKSEEADITVVNHSLLLADILNDNGTIGKYNYLIVDEAHNLPQMAASHLGISLGFAEINQYFQQLFSTRGNLQSGVLPMFKSAVAKSGLRDSSNEFFRNNIERLEDFLKDKLPVTKDFFTKLGNTSKANGSFGKFRIKSLSEVDYMEKEIRVCLDIVQNIGDQLSKIHSRLTDINSNIFVNYETNLGNIEGMVERSQELFHQLESLRNPDFSNNAFWLSNISTLDPKFPKGVINLAPLEVNKLLADTLYDNVNSIVFASATMAIRGKFKYFANRMGLDLIERTVREEIVKSPFDYDEQTKVLVTPFLPSPSDKFYAPQSSRILKEAIKNSRAGTMVLFTSYRDLNTVYDNMKDELYSEDILLLAQGKGMNRTAMVDEFKRHPDSVLLGTSSFWEGVDVQGESLSLLVIYKLPFQVPSEPIVEALIEKMEAEGKNSFMHYMMPNALLKFRQGFGRLIRSKSDKGVILILDQRIAKKYYGKYFQQIIPTTTHFPSSNIELQNHIREWFKKINFEE